MHFLIRKILKDLVESFLIYCYAVHKALNDAMGKTFLCFFCFKNVFSWSKKFAKWRFAGAQKNEKNRPNFRSQRRLLIKKRDGIA